MFPKLTVSPFPLFSILDLLLAEGHRLGAETFTLDVFKDNIPAVRLYANAGFVQTEEIDNAMISMKLSQ